MRFGVVACLVIVYSESWMAIMIQDVGSCRDDN